MGEPIQQPWAMGEAPPVNTMATRSEPTYDLPATEVPPPAGKTISVGKVTDKVLLNDIA